MEVYAPPAAVPCAFPAAEAREAAEADGPGFVGSADRNGYLSNKVCPAASSELVSILW
jgi:hypothetical protein